MAQQLIFDLKALRGERYPSISEFPPSRFVDPAQLRKRPATNIAQMSRILSCLRLPDSLIDLEVSENLLASNPIRSNPCLCGKPQRKQPWGTPVKVKLLLPPRQSRGTLNFVRTDVLSTFDCCVMTRASFERHGELAAWLGIRSRSFVGRRRASPAPRLPATVRGLSDLARRGRWPSSRRSRNRAGVRPSSLRTNAGASAPNARR